MRQWHDDLDDQAAPPVAPNHGMRVRLLAAATALASASGCAPGALTADLAQPPEFSPAGQTKCSVAKSQSRPLIVEWPASDRAALESQAQRGRVVVRYSGCELEVLRRCRAPGSYGYTALTPKQETVSMRDADELYANIPVYAAKFEGALERSGQLNVSMTIVGMYESFEPIPAERQLDGDCSEATHVVHALTVGAFEFYAGAESAAKAGAEFMGAAVGGTSSSARESLSRDGSDRACRAATRRDEEPPDGCGGLLRLEIVPIGAGSPAGPAEVAITTPKPRAAKSSTEPPQRCAPGQQWRQGKCRATASQEDHAVLAPEDAHYRDTQGGAGWGNRCFIHFKAKRLANARAACQRALAMQPTAAIRGAVLYSMAAIEEKADDQPAACRWLQKSLQARPGNGPTVAKLESLGCAE